MQIHVALCDLTELPVDAIVTPTNSQGLMSHGIAAQVLRSGGQAIEEEARDAAPIAVGAAVVTTGGELYAKNVIHVPTTEEPGGKPTIESVRRATRAALVAAAAKGYDIIAMPPMCSHTASVPFDETARAMVDELRAHKQTIPQQVYLVTLKQEMIYAYEEALRNAFIPG
jgi:O-acetyl-ADP-ribose deacetylase